MARTELGRAQRVVLAGHLDTVPINNNFPSDRARRPDVRLRHLRHEVRRRAGAAPGRHAARARATTSPTSSTRPRRSSRGTTGSTWSPQAHPEWLAGRLRGAAGADVRGGRGGLPGHDAGRGHAPPARGPTRPAPGTGSNAIHAAGEVLRRLAGVPGAAGRRSTAATYREGLNAVRISGGVAGNVVPDRVRDRGQLPVRAGPDARAGARRTCARCSTASRWQ